ncbi:MAG TPA: hypothetical protein PKO15_15045, partial [Fibrobacteria bacterium]|nr:hypothetical protein [Fibrobacteria bacterium]
VGGRSKIDGDPMLVAQDQTRGLASWSVYAEYLRNGIVPVWWGSQLGGTPMFESLPGEGVYPPSVVLMLLGIGAKRVGISMWLHIVLAGFSAYLLARRQFSLGRMAAVLMGVLWMFNPYMFSLIYGGHIGKVWILSILPLMLLGLLRYMDTGKLRWAALLSATLGWMLYSTHVQLVYFALWGVFFLWVASMWALRKEMKTMLVRGVGFWVAIAFGLGLGAPILMPAMGFIDKSSVRGEEKMSDEDRFKRASSWSIHWEDVPALAVPEFVGVDLQVAYPNKPFQEITYWGGNPFKSNTEAPGMALLTLGIAALFLAGSTRTWTAAGFGVFAILFGLGAHTPVLKLCYELLPGVSKFRAPSMILFWLAAGLLLGVGALLQALDRLEGKGSARLQKNLLVASAVVGGLGVLFFLVPSLPFSIWTSIFPALRPGAEPWSIAVDGFRLGILRAALVSAGSLLVLRQLSAGSLKREGAIGAWLLLALVDLLGTNNRFIQTTEVGREFEPCMSCQTLQSVPGKFRIMDLGGFQTGFHDFYHLENAGGFSDIGLKWYSRYTQSNPLQGVQMVLENGRPTGAVHGAKLLDILNVQFLLQKDSVGREGLYVNRSVLPRTWVAPRWTFADEDKVIATILDSSFDHRSTVVLLDEDKGNVPASSSDTSLKGSPAEIVDYQPGKIVVKVQPKTPSLLFVADNWYWAWNATVDGVAAPVLRANLSFRAIPVAAGAHMVELRFHNPVVIRAWILGGVVAGVLLLLSGLAWWRKVW